MYGSSLLGEIDQIEQFAVLRRFIVYANNIGSPENVIQAIISGRKIPKNIFEAIDDGTTILTSNYSLYVPAFTNIQNKDQVLSYKDGTSYTVVEVLNFISPRGEWEIHMMSDTA